jgi:hypothetical protein
VQGGLPKSNYSDPSKAHIYDSRVTLIKPHTPLEILMTGNLVRKEALPILKRKMEHCRSQPLLYLVDYSAAWALLRSSSPRRSCLGVADAGASQHENRKVKECLQFCTSYLSQTHQGQDSSQGMRTIKMTITHKDGVSCGMELVKFFVELYKLRCFCYAPTHPAVIYKYPLPLMPARAIPRAEASNGIETILLEKNAKRGREWIVCCFRAWGLCEAVCERSFREAYDGLGVVLDVFASSSSSRSVHNGPSFTA